MLIEFRYRVLFFPQKWNVGTPNVCLAPSSCHFAVVSVNLVKLSINTITEVWICIPDLFQIISEITTFRQKKNSQRHFDEFIFSNTCLPSIQTKLAFLRTEYFSAPLLQKFKFKIDASWYILRDYLFYVGDCLSLSNKNFFIFLLNAVSCVIMFLFTNWNVSASIQIGWTFSHIFIPFSCQRLTVFSCHQNRFSKNNSSSCRRVLIICGWRWYEIRNFLRFIHRNPE